MHGGCLGGGGFESPACPDAIVQPVSEADAAEAHHAARSARAESGLFATLDPAQSGSAVTLDVAVLEEVERVDRSPACTDDVGHRATAQLELYSADGTIAIRVPGLVSLPSEGPVGVAVITATIPADDMASSCESFEDCDAVERFAIASWVQPPLDFDLWFERVGP